MNLRRLLLSLLALLALQNAACHRRSDGTVTVHPNVPLAIAASVLGGGRVLLDPLATRALVGTILLHNTLADGTPNGRIRCRVDAPDGYEAEATDFELAPGEQRAIAIYTTLVAAALLTVTVYAVYAAGGAEQAFPVQWTNELAGANVLALVALLGQGQQFAARFFAAVFLAAVGLTTRHSSPQVPPRVPSLVTEIRMIGVVAAFLTLLELHAAFGNADGGPTFPVGPGPEGFTVAASPAAPLAAGDHCLFWLSVQAPIPLADPERHYQYAFVMDADAIPANNYQPGPAFPDDFFANTDRWYELRYAPGQGWTLQCKVAQAGAPVAVVASAAHAVLRGDTLVLVVPRSEFAVANPPFRATSFCHRGDFGLQPPHEWAGDPTPPVGEALQVWQ